MNTIEMKRAGDLVRLTLRRPPLNYLNLELLQALQTQLEDLGDSPDCLALIVESEGKAFSAGLDMAEQTRDRVFLLIERFHLVARLLHSFPRPTIAVVRGMALGAGNELAACCDFVFASEGALFGQPEIKFGSMPSLAPLVLPPLIGSRRTVELILTGDFISAKDALRMGLVYSVSTDEKVWAMVEALLDKFRHLSRAVSELVLQSARRSRVRALEQHLREVESLYLDRLMDLEDCAEGTKAFLEKRVPKWQNR
jgi:cyclohexa-1,5-dienecarbonyl-CoA hydratase